MLNGSLKRATAPEKGKTRLPGDEPPTDKRSREHEPDPPQDGQSRSAAVSGRQHCPSGCPPILGVLVAVVASLIASAKGMSADGKASMSFMDVELSDMW